MAAFDLQPAPPPAGAIGGVGPLGDHALEAAAAQLPQHPLAAALDMIGEEDRPGPALASEQAAQPLLALRQRQVPQVLSTLRQKVKGEIGQRAAIPAFPALERPLQPAEIAASRAVDHHHLAVDQRSDEHTSELQSLMRIL